VSQVREIWVDADACPRAIKEILFRAAERARVRVTLVANQALALPASPYLRSVRVGGGLDAADRRIAALVEAGDLVVTADIPLAAQVVGKDALALDPRGQLYTPENVKERLAVRNLLDELRGIGVNTGGPPVLSASDRRAFASRLDAWLARISQPEHEG
jgi:uncharacterized protein YaiI (UPF0178 family)